MLEMLGLPQHHPVSRGPATEYRDAMKDIYKDAIAKWESHALETEVNERWRQPGVTCLTKEEFAATKHGQMSIKEPLYKILPVHEQLPPVPWLQASPGGPRQPLSGIKVLDLTKVIAGPTITRVLALMGADVLRVSSHTTADATFALFDGQLGKRDTNLDLKTRQGRASLQTLMEEADVVVDGFRPGVLKRLGFGNTWAHELARRRGRGMVYCRENCYGWTGEWSDRSGYQQISDCVSPVLKSYSLTYHLDPVNRIDSILTSFFCELGIWGFLGARPVPRSRRARCPAPPEFGLPVSTRGSQQPQPYPYRTKSLTLFVLPT